LKIALICAVFFTLVSQGIAQNALSNGTMPMFRRAEVQTQALQPQHQSKAKKASPAPAPIPAAAPTKPKAHTFLLGVEGGITSTAFTDEPNFFIPFATLPSNVVIGGRLYFDNMGSGLGFMFGGVAEYHFSDIFALQFKPSWQLFSASSKESHMVLCPSDEISAIQETSEHTSTWTMTNASLLARVQVISTVYGLAGFGFSSVSNTFKAHQSLDDATCSYVDTNGFITNVQEIDIPSQKLGLYNTSRTDFKLGVGSEAPIGNGFLFAEFIINFPLTSFIAEDSKPIYTPSNTSIPSMFTGSLTIGIKWPIGGEGSSSSSYDDGGSTVADNPGSNTSAKYHLKGKVTDRNGNGIEDANMTAVDLNSNEVVATGTTNSDGEYDLGVDKPGKYSVTADAEGYLFGTTYFEVGPDGRIVQGNHDLQLGEVASGRTRLLVFFDFNKSSLQQASYPELNRAARFLRANPSMEVEIAGYTDNVGSDAYNLDLSQRRANSVREYLIAKGVEENRITAKGYGKASPIATNDTDDGRAQNRRVEFVVTKR